MNRRTFILNAGMAGIGLYSSALSFKKKNPVILIVSGWQDVNIGDIAHTPGLLHVFEELMPGARIILWKRSRGEEVRKMLENRFPSLRIIYGDSDASGNTSSKEVLEAIIEADIMIHGSGPSLVGADNLACWMKNTAKPFGVFGVTLQSPNVYHQGILKKASFIFTRETESTEHLRKAGITGSHIAFAPDATFYFDLHNRNKADAFLKVNGLEEKKFISVIPRLRYTPYHLFNPNRNGWSDQKIKSVEETNKKFAEEDHAKMREAMITWVRQTGNKVLVCPEMTYEVDIMDELLINPLPEDVKPKVVKHGYWLPDEAASTYAKTFAVLSFECHSPILAAANNIPFFYLRQPEDTIKGQMYYDLGYGSNVFEIGSTTGKQISDGLMSLHSDYNIALKNIKNVNRKVTDLYSEAFRIIQKFV